MKLVLTHGRKPPDEDMDDWGFTGPIIEGISYAHTTYGAHIKIGFFTKEAMQAAQEATGWEEWDELALEAPIHGTDLLHTKDGYFGDWEFQEDYEAHKVLKALIEGAEHNDTDKVVFYATQGRKLIERIEE